MDIPKFLFAYRDSRNGANYFVNQLLKITPGNVPFQYSDGVKQCAEAGCYWLLDIIATECCKPLRESGSPTSIVKVMVLKGNKAIITLTVDDSKPAVWVKTLEHTDMPLGTWDFELVDERTRFALILLSEH